MAVTTAKDAIRKKVAKDNLIFFILRTSLAVKSLCLMLSSFHAGLKFFVFINVFNILIVWTGRSKK